MPIEGRHDPGLAWSWSGALRGAAYAVPGVVAMPGDVATGLALAVGVLPASIVGLPPLRRQRRRIAVSGALVGAPIVVGSTLAHVPLLAVAAMFGLAVGAVALADRVPAGRIAVVLGLPMVGVGLSYDDGGEALGIAALMIAGSVYASLVALLWPEGSGEGPRTPPDAGGSAPRLGVGYGVRLGAAGATAAAIGFALDLDHVGWAAAAALLVMRPAAEMQRLRSVGRIASVAAGAAAAVAWIRTDPATLGYSAAALLALAAAAATHRSRWYVSSAFTTYLVFLLLLHSAPEDAPARFGERVGETVLGVGVAYAFGVWRWRGGAPGVTRRDS